MNLFEFYVDGDKFYDVRIDQLALINPVLELTVNTAGTFTFTLPPGHPKYDSFKPLTSTIEIYRDGEWFWEGRIIDKKGDFYNKSTYTVEGAQAYLNDSIQPQWEYQGNLIGYMEHILNVHNSQVPDNRKIYLGAVTVEDNNDYIRRFTNFTTSLKEIKEDIIDDVGGYLRIRKQEDKLYLDVLEDYGRTCSQVIRLRENLIDLSPSFDYSDIASVIIPLGATLDDQEEHEEGLEELDKYVTIEEVNDGKKYIAREDLLETYNKIWRVVRFENVHLPELLLTKAKNYLKDGQWGEMVIQAKAFDLNYTSEEFQEFRLGDRIRVKSDLHGIDRFFPLTSQTIHFNDIAQNTITLGGTGEPISITGVTNEVTINNEKLDERIKDPNRLIQQAIYQATQLITQGLNGYVRVNGNEILIMDTDDPETAKHVWRWNMGGLGYSNNGYNGPFETAMTMDGTIVGKFLAANSVAAEQLDVNYRSHVEQQISEAESDANDYTDGKLKNYWTSKEVETKLKTTADSVTASVNTTLKSYSTTEQIKAMLSITEGNITTYVSNELKDYSTTYQVQSMIKQSADSITTTVSEVQKDVSGLESSLKSVEQKVTTDGIFTIINNGIAGSEKIYNTKFSMTKSGLTIQGGGIEILNNAGTRVLYADTSGNLTMRGDFMHYGSGGYQAIGIEDHQIRIYAYNQSGNYLGTLGAITLTGSSTPRIGLYSDYGDDLVLGTKSSSYGSTINDIIRLGSYGGTAEIKYIRGTVADSSIPYGQSSIGVKNGLITSIGTTAKKSDSFWIGDAYLTFDNGLCTGWYNSKGIGSNGTFNVGPHNIVFDNGIMKSFHVDTTINDSYWINKGYITFTKGVCTAFVRNIGNSGTFRLGSNYIVFNNGIMDSFSNPSNGTQGQIDIGGTINIQDGLITSASTVVGIDFNLIVGEWNFQFIKGVLTGYTHV